MQNLTDSRTMYHSSDSSCRPENPARGFYVQIDSGNPDRLEDLHPEGITLCLLAYDIYDYRDRPIPEEKLQELRDFLQTAKENRIQCIFRAAYGFRREKSNDAASWELLSQHVGQIAPILNAFKNQVYCVQAGFLGPWGEWHSSRWTEDDREAPTRRRDLLAQLLRSLDPDITVNVRRPRFIREYGESSRLGYHDDGLLSTQSDYGTYDDPDFTREQELRWMRRHIWVPQNGGEMPLVSTYSEPENARREFARLKLSYLNSRYNQEVLKDWAGKTLEGENALSYLSGRLGYRYYVSRIQMPNRMRRGLLGLGQKVTVTVSNEGFAPIDSRYRWELIMEDAHGLRVLATFRPETRKPGDLTFAIGGSLLRKAETCRLGLRLLREPDDWVRLTNGSMEPENGIYYILSVEKGKVLDLIPQ